jgi:hypothetical protein
MVVAGVFVDERSDAVAVALIVVGAGMFFIGMLAPTLSEFKIGPGGFSAKLRERERDVQTALGPDVDGLTRTATWLTGSPEAGKKLVERALIETYMRWPDAQRRGSADAMREKIVELAPEGPPTYPPTTAVGSTEAPGASEQLLARVIALPHDERSALVLHLLDGIDRDGIASIVHQKPETVDQNLTRAASALGSAPGGAS